MTEPPSFKERLAALRAERDAWIAEQVAAGRRQAQIAAEVGLTQAHVSRIALRHGVRRYAKRTDRADRADRAELDRQIAALVASDPRTMAEIAAELGLTQGYVSKIANRQGVSRTRGRRPGYVGPQDPERSARIRAMAEAGMTFEAIGAEFGITRERVRQLLRQQGVSPTEFVQARNAAKRDAAMHPTCPLCGEVYERGTGHKQKGRHLGMQLRFPERTAAIVADYQAGMKIREIMAKHSVGATQVTWALRRTGHQPNRRATQPLPTRAESHARQDAIRADLAAGHPRTAIAERYGVSISLVHALARRLAGGRKTP